MEFVQYILSNFWSWLHGFEPEKATLILVVPLFLATLPVWYFLLRKYSSDVPLVLTISLLASLVISYFTDFSLKSTFTVTYEPLSNYVCTEIKFGAGCSETIETMVFVRNDLESAGDVIKVPATFWKEDPRFEGFQLVPFEGHTVSKIKSHPITENPKVREVSYEVVFEPINDPQDLMKWQKTLRASGLSSHNWVKFNLYNFNELHSKEVGKFFNPLDSNQQAEFRSLIEQYFLTNQPDSGRRLKSARFSFDQ